MYDSNSKIRRVRGKLSADQLVFAVSRECLPQ